MKQEKWCFSISQALLFFKPLVCNVILIHFWDCKRTSHKCHTLPNACIWAFFLNITVKHNQLLLFVLTYLFLKLHYARKTSLTKFISHVMSIFRFTSGADWRQQAVCPLIGHSIYGLHEPLIQPICKMMLLDQCFCKSKTSSFTEATIKIVLFKKEFYTFEFCTTMCYSSFSPSFYTCSVIQNLPL